MIGFAASSVLGVGGTAAMPVWPDTLLRDSSVVGLAGAAVEVARPDCVGAAEALALATTGLLVSAVDDGVAAVVAATRASGDAF